MPYREDEEARAAHLASLEERVASLEAENARLLIGERPAETLFGVPLTIVASHERVGVLSKKAHRRALIGTERVVNQPGRLSAGDSVAVWRSSERDLDVTLRREGDLTTLRVAERIGLVTGAMVGGVVGGAGGVAALATVIWIVSGQQPIWILLAVPVWVLIMYGVARLLMSRHIRARQRTLDAYANALSDRLPALAEETETEKPPERS